jgi:hypothetical protein
MLQVLFGHELTISYFNAQDGYLDFEETSSEFLQHAKSRAIVQQLTPPAETKHLIIDISVTEQSMIKRHWKTVSTIAIVLWGIVILARRLGT